MENLTKYGIIGLVLIIASVMITVGQNIDYSYPNDAWIDRVISSNQTGTEFIFTNITVDNLNGGAVLNKTYADASYLFINTSNDPLTGNLDMGNNDLLNVNQTKTVRVRFLSGDNSSYIKINDGEWIGVDESMIFGNNLATPGLGQIVALFYTQENTTNLWLQSGKNNSYSAVGNSFGVIPNTAGINYFSEGGKINMSSLSSYINYCTYLQDNLSLVPDGCQYFADTSGRMVPLLFGGDLEVHRSAAIHELLTLFTGILSMGTADFIMEGNHFEVINGSIHQLNPVTYETGFVKDDKVTLLNAIFPGALTPFANEVNPSADWSVTSSIYCDDGTCGVASSSLGINDAYINMSTSFSTLNFNETYLTFVFSNKNLKDADEEIIAEINNGSGWVQIFSNNTKEVVLATENVSIGSGYWNQSNIDLRFVCRSGKDNRLCYVDTVKVIGFATATTLANQSGFDSNYCTSDGSLDVNNQCNTGIVYDAESDTHLTKGTWNITGTVVGGVTGSGTANTISKWSGTSSQTNSNILDDGTTVKINSNVNHTTYSSYYGDSRLYNNGTHFIID